MTDRIGIEKEFWLLNEKGEIMEPAIYGFPFDEYGFLVELRTYPWKNIAGLIENFNVELEDLSTKCLTFGFVLSDKPTIPRPVGLIEYLAPKYKHDSLQDLTANINSGVISSHATGIFEGFLTAGIHMHFSRHDQFGRRVQLPIETIVRKMDWNFRSIIMKGGRILGEYELKPYGFEYRSLPANAPLGEVVRRAFKILGSCK